MLTPREQDIYRFIQQYWFRHGKTPLLREIAESVGLTSRGFVHRYIQSLTEKGYITITSGHRSINLTKKVRFGRFPLLGQIAVGRPIEAILGQDEINLFEMMNGPNRFVLKVKGDSMIEAGILDGDFVICERGDTAMDKEIVVVTIDDAETTLKSLRLNIDGSVSLLPANNQLPPMTYAFDRIKIQGKVVGQIRSYR